MLGFGQMTRSNDIGRTLEYVIVKVLKDSLNSRVFLDDFTIKNQARDSKKFNLLDNPQKTLLLFYADSVRLWIEKNFSISKAKKIIIIRLSDIEGVKGDVTDIRIIIDTKKINLSIKHNHSALKHQRPSRTAVQFGFLDNSKEDKDFRTSLDKVYKKFHLIKSKDFPNTKSFNDIKKKRIDFVENYLYYPVCNLIKGFINKNSGQKVLVSHFFYFLVGNTDFYKLKMNNGCVEIQEYANIESPSKVKARLHKKSYIILTFSNGWIIEMRLHSASTLITKRPSLKFDTNALKLPIKIINLSY